MKWKFHAPEFTDFVLYLVFSSVGELGIETEIEFVLCDFELQN